MNLTIAYITARKEPRLDWFLDSLARQTRPDNNLQIIVVDTHPEGRNLPSTILHTEPKPTVWQGKSRLTKQDWWAVSNSKNTAICLCRNDWIAFLDDRCVLQHNWLNALRNARERGYGILGTYQKRVGISVENGVIKHAGIVIGEDGRRDYVKQYRADAAPTPAPGSWAFGCSLAIPLEWCLAVNGYPEECDSLSMEDVIFGMMLENNGFNLQFDHRMAVVQDRTPGQIGPDIARSSKERHPNDPTDKGHEALRRFGKQKRSSHHWDIRAIRDAVLAGGKFPDAAEPTNDWYDGQPLHEFDGKRL